VALADVNEKEVQAAAKELADKGFKTLAIRCDVSNDDEVEAMVKQTVATFGRLDMAFNNAGIQNVLTETADSPRDDYDRVMAINLRGVWSCMKFELQVMREQGSGAIVNCSSLGGLVGGNQRGTYHAAAAWRNRSYEECGSRICNSRHSCERCMPGSHPYTDGRPNGGRRSRRGAENHARDACSHAARRPSRRDCEHRSVPVQ